MRNLTKYRPPVQKQLRKVEDYSDEEIEKYLSKQGYVRATDSGIYWLCDVTAIAEIVVRYEALSRSLLETQEELEKKNKECEQLRTLELRERYSPNS